MIRSSVIAVLLALAAVTPLWPSDANEEVIVVVRREEPIATPAPATSTPAAARPASIDEIYDRFTNFPGQIWLDSPSGPKPLFGMDVVYDANGYPVPRLPDPYTYRLLQNPFDTDAMQQYLDWRRAAIRRINGVANSIPDYAVASGVITKEMFQVDPKRPTDNKAVGDMSKVTPESIGTPLIDQGRARELGMKANEVPKLPGEPSKSGVEVYWFWHYKCTHCLKVARDWFAFQRAVNAAGHKAMSIAALPLRTQGEIETASTDVSSTIEVWTMLWGQDVQQSRNWLDWTGACDALGINETPTFIFVNRHTLRIERLVGEQSQEALRTMLAEVGGWDPRQWPPPSAEPDDEVRPAAPSKPSANATPIATLSR